MAITSMCVVTIYAGYVVVVKNVLNYSIYS